MDVKTIFNKYDETKDYIPDTQDKIFIYSGYIFVIQTRNDFNNIIFAKFDKSNHSLKNILFAFLNWLKSEKIEYIRIEGTTKRYMFLTKMFKNYVSLIKDKRITDRNVFYGKIIYGGN